MDGHPYWTDGFAEVAETGYTPFAARKDARPVRLIVRRVHPTPVSQLALFTLWDHHPFITDRDGGTPLHQDAASTVLGPARPARPLGATDRPAPARAVAVGRGIQALAGETPGHPDPA